MVEHQLPKLRVVGSSPIARFRSRARSDRITVVDFFKRLFGQGDANETQSASGEAIVVPPDTSGKPIVARDVEADESTGETPS